MCIGNFERIIREDWNMKQFVLLILIVCLGKLSGIKYILANFHFTKTSLNLRISVINDENLILAKTENIKKCEEKSKDLHVSLFFLGLKLFTFLVLKFIGTKELLVFNFCIMVLQLWLENCQFFNIANKS